MYLDKSTKTEPNVGFKKRKIIVSRLILLKKGNKVKKRDYMSILSSNLLLQNQRINATPYCHSLDNDTAMMGNVH